MKILKKTGRILLCPLPLLVMFLIQIGITFFLMLILAFLTPDAYTSFMEYYSAFLLVIQAVTLFIFALWYFLAYGRKGRISSPLAVLTGKDAGILLLLGLGAYLLISFYLQIATVLTPDLIADYETMIEESGIADLTLLSTLSTLLLAPLSEELIFRGVTFRLSQKAFGSFWIANLVQALFFGIAHMNWIQGTYAFALGLLLGYICEKYRSLLASMLLHLFFNFFGTYLAALLGLFSTSDLMNWVLTILFLFLGAALLLFALRWIHRTKSQHKKEAAIWTGEPL